MPKRSVNNTEPSLSKFGTALSEVMRSRGLTQGAVGDLIGYAQTSVSDWCLGLAEPRASTVFALEELLSLSAGQLSRHLGYVPVALLDAVPGVVDALRADPALDETIRRALIGAYREYLRAKGEIIHGVSVQNRQQR